MKLNKTILKAYATKKDKTELDNIILVTDNELMRNNLVTTVCTLYFENNDDFISSLKELIQKNSNKLKYMVFLPIMKKANNEIFASQFNSTFLNIKIDVDAWKVRKRKSDNYYLQNENELIKNITDFAIERDYFLTGIEDLDNKEPVSINLDNTVMLVNDLGIKKSLENLDFKCELLNLHNHEKYKSKKIILINNNSKAILATLLKYCFTIKVVNISIMDKESIVKQINNAKEILPKWVNINNKGNYRLNQDLLAIQYINNNNLIQVLNMDKLDSYIYDNGIYRLITKEFIKKEIGEYIPEGISSNNFISDTVHMVNNRAKLVNFEDLNADENIINFKNGIYNISKDELEPHNPDILSTIQINCNYEKGCKDKGKKFQSYLVDLCTDALTGELDEEKLEHLQLWGGLTISNIPMYKAKACLCLFSKNGDTGKSVFLNILNTLLGTENTSTIPIQDLAKPFATSGIYGKRANIVGDQKATALQDSSIFKQFTGGDLLNVEFKGKTSFSYRHNGGLLFACNVLPYISDDKGTHIYDRLHIIPFNNVIPIEKRNSNLLNELKEELEFISQWFLIGLKKFISYGYKIPKCTASSLILETYRENNDHFYSYLVNNYIITKDPKDRVVKTDFESNYIKWCEDEEIPEKARLNKRAIKGVLLDNYNIPLGYVQGKKFYKGLKHILKANIEQGEHIEKEAKEIFDQQVLE